MRSRKTRLQLLLKALLLKVTRLPGRQRKAKKEKFGNRELGKDLCCRQRRKLMNTILCT